MFMKSMLAKSRLQCIQDQTESRGSVIMTMYLSSELTSPVQALGGEVFGEEKPPTRFAAIQEVFGEEGPAETVSKLASMRCQSLSVPHGLLLLIA